MRIKRVEASSVQEALRLLRQDLGDDALILRTKTLPPRGLVGRASPRVEVLGAVDAAPALPAMLPPTAPSLGPARAATAAPPLAGERKGGKKGRKNKKARKAAKAEHARRSATENGKPKGADAAGARRDTVAADAAAAMLPPANEHPSVACTPACWDRNGDRARRIAFVGPTGAGKTTTLAKIAARAQLEHGRRISLITIDTYRIGAVPQLASYAAILGVPLTVAQTPDDLAAALERTADADLVFIDTTGRSPLGGGVDALRPFMERAGADEVYLVVSATTRLTDSLRAAGSFAQLGPNRLCVTKLDETEDHSAVPILSEATALPLTWLGVGQEVPDDLDQADGKRMQAILARSDAA